MVSPGVMVAVDTTSSMRTTASRARRVARAPAVPRAASRDRVRFGGGAAGPAGARGGGGACATAVSQRSQTNVAIANMSHSSLPMRIITPVTTPHPKLLRRLGARRRADRDGRHRRLGHLHEPVGRRALRREREPRDGGLDRRRRHRAARRGRLRGARRAASARRRPLRLHARRVSSRARVHLRLDAVARIAKRRNGRGGRHVRQLFRTADGLTAPRPGHRWPPRRLQCSRPSTPWACARARRRRTSS